ncbi:hypothetical protein LTR27_006857 [Elasticomyces elasticus]|nr:hypothetical protein LTR27_006857 [Elasticomyces elasticus]
MNSHTIRQMRWMNAVTRYGYSISSAEQNQAMKTVNDWASSHGYDEDPFSKITWFGNNHCPLHNHLNCLLWQEVYNVRYDCNTSPAPPPPRSEWPISTAWGHFRQIYNQGTVTEEKQAFQANEHAQALALAQASSSTNAQPLPVPGAANAAIHGSAPQVPPSVPVPPTPAAYYMQVPAPATVSQPNLVQYGNSAQQYLPAPQYQQQINSPYPQPVQQAYLQQPMQPPLPQYQYQYQQSQPPVPQFQQYQPLPQHPQQPMGQQQPYPNHQLGQQMQIAGSQPQMLLAPPPTPGPGRSTLNPLQTSKHKTLCTGAVR